MAPERTIAPAFSHQSPGFMRLLGILGSVPTVGLNLPVSTALAIATLPLRRTTPWPTLTKALAVTAGIGSIALVVSALANGVPLSVSSVAQFAMCALFIVAYRISVTDEANAARVVGWLASTMVVFYVVAGPENTRDGLEGLWKYGIAYPATFAAIYWLIRRGAHSLWSAVLLVGLGVGGYFLDFRSHGLVCFAAAAIIAAKGVGEQKAALRTLLLGGAALVALSVALPAMMTAGVFGEAVQMRTIAQSEAGPLILGGRSESPLGIAVISRAPLLGIGNAQEVTSEHIEVGIEVAEALGMSDPATYLPLWIRDGGRVSLHSVFLISWVEGGVVAAAFPALLLWLFGKVTFVARGRWAPLVVVASLQGIWDVMFSPWGANKSVVVASSVILASMALTNATGRSPAYTRLDATSVDKNLQNTDPARLSMIVQTRSPRERMRLGELDEARAHSWNHWAGRLLPGRTTPA